MLNYFVEGRGVLGRWSGVAGPENSRGLTSEKIRGRLAGRSPGRSEPPFPLPGRASPSPPLPPCPADTNTIVRPIFSDYVSLYCTIQ